MKTRQMTRATATLLLATSLVTFGCKSPLSAGGPMGEKPRQGVVLRDIPEETKVEKPLTVVPVPQQKDVKEGEKPEIVPQKAIMTKPPTKKRVGGFQ